MLLAPLPPRYDEIITRHTSTQHRQRGRRRTLDDVMAAKSALAKVCMSRTSNEVEKREEKPTPISPPCVPASSSMSLCREPRACSASRSIDASSLASTLEAARVGLERLLIVDCRCFIDYNDSHINSAVNAFYAKIIRRRIQQNKLNNSELLQQFGSTSNEGEEGDISVVLYDRAIGAADVQGEAVDSITKRVNMASSFGGFRKHAAHHAVLTPPAIHPKRHCLSRPADGTAANVSSRTSIEAPRTTASGEPTNDIVVPGVANLPTSRHPCIGVRTAQAAGRAFKSRMAAKREACQEDREEFMRTLIQKIASANKFASVMLLKGGFSEFQSRYPEHCEASAGKVDDVPDSSSSPPPSMSQSMTSGALKRQASTGAACIAMRSYAQNSLSQSQPCLPMTNAGPTKILPYLYLGSQQDAQDVEMLKARGINYVVNMSSNLPRCEHISPKHFLRIKVNDNYNEKLRPHFDKAFDFIDKVREADAAVLVHCLAGISRSPTLAIAYIMKTIHMDSDVAYMYIKSKRSSISPNFNFMGQLLEFEKELCRDRGRQAHMRLKESMKRPLALSKTKRIATKQKGITTLAMLIEAAKARGQCIDALSDTETPVRSTIASMQKSSDVKFRSPQPVDDDFCYTDDEETMYMRRSLSCPIKMHKSSSETRLSIRRPPEFDNVEEEPVVDTPPVATVDTIRGKANADAAVIDATPVLPSMCRSESTPNNLTAGKPFTLQRPHEGIFSRMRNRMLRIPGVVKEDLPSPSTDFNNRLSFTDPPPSSGAQSAANPFFRGDTSTLSSICRPSLCSASSVLPSLCGTGVLDANSPPANTPSSSFADAIVSQQPTTTSMDVGDDATHVTPPFAANPTFRSADHRRRTPDVNQTVRQSTTSTDSGVGSQAGNAGRLEALFRRKKAVEACAKMETSASTESNLAQEMEIGDVGGPSFVRDGERESMGSTSSLEIAVNS